MDCISTQEFNYSGTIWNKRNDIQSKDKTSTEVDYTLFINICLLKIALIHISRYISTTYTYISKNLMALIVSLNNTQRDPYGVFRL